ncbi:putative beta-lysine N-acetyltransferase [Desulfosporosinus orientis DSM 765]|uniref:Putative beta-lysine N-acetyltransferase n=1 Tax=Desulfosporosinus orientis (strain ATCC 19365 / DSM 765 / NCIMB 8382 / VKM B-1628 / Singapore I) TaxID=768706 RepID=G7WE58_DESOD|nr:putative beta-lysine N-acetyltransferase [Desulfosporosinus orientis]AET70034.1 putative beta-lysine N-acetyltransferase [Desulfosporosinus orientis DSM 765]
MLNTMGLCSLKSVIVDERNKRLVVNGYPEETNPAFFSRELIDFAVARKLEKIWLWAIPADVPEFLGCGFRTEGSLFRDKYDEFAISLAYYVSFSRGNSDKLESENDIINTVRTEPIRRMPSLPQGMELKLLNESFAPEISKLLTQVFKTYPSPVEDDQYVQSLIKNGNIFAGAFFEERLVAVAAAYPDDTLKRCEMTDCATLKEYRGYSLSQRLLDILEQEIQKYGSYILFTLARAQSYGMNRVFHKLGYRFQGRLIKNCDIAGSFEDMNLWVK